MINVVTLWCEPLGVHTGYAEFNSVLSKGIIDLSLDVPFYSSGSGKFVIFTYFEQKPYSNEHKRVVSAIIKRRRSNREIFGFEGSPWSFR